MLDLLSAGVSAAWALWCFAALAVALPGLAVAWTTRRPVLPELLSAFVWTWLAVTLGVPALVAVRGFNWATAVLMVPAWIAAWWMMHQGRDVRRAFRRAVRVGVIGVVSGDRARVLAFRAACALAALPILALLLAVTRNVDLRLPAPADFDVLWRVRQLLDGRPQLDPLTALIAFITRVSSIDDLRVAVAIRLAIVALGAAAVGRLAAVCVGRRAAGVAVATLLLGFAPWAPAVTWGAALAAAVGATALVSWIREGRAREASGAIAALTLGCLQVVCLDSPRVLLQFSRAPQYLEHRAAPQVALRFSRATWRADWALVAMPEQQLQAAGRGRFHDLAWFVARFRDRAGDPRFRFDLGPGFVLVIVEKAPLPPVVAPGVRFVSQQRGVYRAPRERQRLARAADAICVQYRRTHPGVSIVYEDADLRVYRIDV